MDQASLRDRLRRLQHPAAPLADGAGRPGIEAVSAAERPAPRNGALSGLERALLGSSGDGLSLKQRLERLVAATASRERGRPTRPASLAELVPGRVVENAHGEFYLIEREVHLDAFHGELPLGRLRLVAPESVGVLSGEPELGGFELRDAAFLDTETTGIAGGSGTAAFLVGLGFVRDERFVVRQYFMRDYNEEAAMLLALAEDLARFQGLVTFNGKLFDVPLLETRYRLNRAPFPLQAAAHLDLLHPARRLWKLRLESCRLQSLESALLGVTRRGDIPGSEIPHRYFRYVRQRDALALAPIFGHNHTDIVSLAALAALACQWVAEGRAEDARDVYSLARVLERADRLDASAAAYRKTLSLAAGPLRAQALLRLAAQAKRARDHATAAELWEQAAEQGECLAFRELAIHQERRLRDPRRALILVDHALGRLGEDRCCRRTREDFGRRRTRLVAKIARQGSAPAASRSL